MTTGPLLQVQPHEAGHFLAHERGALAVDLAELLARLLPGLRVAGRVDRILHRPVGLLPFRVLLRGLRFAEAFRRGTEADTVADAEVEFAVAVDVSHPDPARPRGAGQVFLAEEPP